jgi:hypothetical protein
MAFKIKDGIRIGTVDVFDNSGVLLVPAPSLITARNIALTGNVTGNVNFDGSANVSITTTIANDAVTLGTQTTGSYVESITGSDGISITGGTGEGSTPNVTNVDRGSAQNIFKNIANSGGTTQFSASTNNDTIRFAGGGGTQVSFNSGTNTVTISTNIPDEADTLQSVTDRGKTTTNDISITNTTASTSTTTGALIVSGGAGIGGALNVGGAISTTNGSLTTSATTANLFNTGATTLNIGGAATTVGIGASTGNTTVNNNLVVTGNLTVQGTSTTINTATLQVEDQNIELGKVDTPTNATANGGGITVLAGVDGDKTWSWFSATQAWTSSEHINIVSGKEYRIDGTSVLSATTLGSGVVNSSLTSVGTLTSGTWNATTIAVNRGGTGQTSYTNGQLLIGNSTGNTLTKATLTAGANVTITNGAGSITIASDNTEYDIISEAEATDDEHTSPGRLITGQRIAHILSTITVDNATTAGQTAQSVTFDNSGAGDASGTTFNGSTARTISFNTLGAVPSTRTLTGSNGIAAIGDLSANRTIQLTGQALALHNLATNGIIARTNTGTVAARTITAGTDISVTNGDGVAGNPTINATSTLATVTGRGATTSSVITITNSTAATTTTTGALIVTGGIATANNIHVGGEVRDDHTHSRSTTTTVATTAVTNVDTFAVSAYRSGRYIIQITQGTNYQMSEFRIIHDGTTTYITEYAVLETNGELGNFTADISGADVRIRVAMNTATSATIKLNRTLITV